MLPTCLRSPVCLRRYSGSIRQLHTCPSLAGKSLLSATLVYLGNKCVHELQACEREEAAEDRAEEAEEALETSNRKLQEAEAALEVAQQRVKLLEVQLLNRAVSHAKLDCTKSADSDCLVRDSPSVVSVRCPACSPACRCSKEYSMQGAVLRTVAKQRIWQHK